MLARSTIGCRYHRKGVIVDECGPIGTALAEIYNWFTEGFDTADLKDAKALLDDLNK